MPQCEVCGNDYKRGTGARRQRQARRHPGRGDPEAARGLLLPGLAARAPPPRRTPRARRASVSRRCSAPSPPARPCSQSRLSTGSPRSRSVIGAYVLIVSAVLAWYVARVMMLEGTFKRSGRGRTRRPGRGRCATRLPDRSATEIIDATTVVSCSTSAESAPDRRWRRTGGVDARPLSHRLLRRFHSRARAPSAARREMRPIRRSRRRSAAGGHPMLRACGPGVVMSSTGSSGRTGDSRGSPVGSVSRSAISLGYPSLVASSRACTDTRDARMTGRRLGCHGGLVPAPRGQQATFRRGRGPEEATTAEPRGSPGRGSC